MTKEEKNVLCLIACLLNYFKIIKILMGIIFIFLAILLSVYLFDKLVILFYFPCIDIDLKN